LVTERSGEDVVSGRGFVVKRGRRDRSMRGNGVRVVLVAVITAMVVGLAMPQPSLAGANDSTDPEAYLANDQEMSRFGYWHDRNHDNWLDDLEIAFRGRLYRTALNGSTMGLFVALSDTNARAYALHEGTVERLTAAGWSITPAESGSLSEHLGIGRLSSDSGAEGLLMVHRIGRVVGMTVMGGPRESVSTETINAVHEYFVVRARSRLIALTPGLASTAGTASR
jgi:hypothetical protein